MKLSKKVLAAMSAATLIMTAGIFTSCGEEEADDENNMITGSNNDYVLSYDNTESVTSRSYVPTKNNHRGALVQIQLDKGYTGSGAAMGFIWDLYSTDTTASAEEVARAVSAKPRNLCIASFANFGGTYKAYVSRYTNVYDIQAENFGTEDKGGVTVNGTKEYAVEKEYIKASDNKTLTKVDDNYAITVNVYEQTEEKTVEGSTDTETWYTGAYVVDIYNGLVTAADLEAAEPPAKLATTVISADDLGYTAVKKSLTSHAVAQKQCGVYANVYAKSKATGTWKYLDTYSADEVVED